MFWRNTYHLGRYTEVEEYHTGRYGDPDGRREKKRKPTPEDMARVNHQNKVKRCRRKLRMYFEKGDYFFLLTYAKDKRPADMDEAVEDFRKLVGKLRPIYKKHGVPCRWIRNIEQGSKGAWHIHLAIKAIPGVRLDVIIQDLWEEKHGHARSEAIRETGGFRDLAEYLTKSETVDSRFRECGYSTSRNMPLPEPEKKLIRWRTFRKNAQVPKGFELEKGSLNEGINPVTGFPYRSYAYYRLEGKSGKKCKEPRGCPEGHNKAEGVP